MLNDAKIKAAKGEEAPYKLGDSGQLYLLVTKTAKLWRMNYTFGRNAKGNPKQKTLSLGEYPAVTLLKARAARDAAKAMLAEGKDPAVERKLAVIEQQTDHESTFEVVAIRWFELNSGWSVEKLRGWLKENPAFSRAAAPAWTVEARQRWSIQQAYDIFRSLDRDIFPHLGRLPIKTIKAPRILTVLQLIEARGAVETAHRIRQRISAVFSYAVNSGLCDSDPAGKLGESLRPVPKARPQPSIIDGITDHDAQLAAVRKLLGDCEAQRTRAVTKLALRFLALTAVRPGDELAGARWEEFEDLEGEAPLWIIPASRMKGDTDRKEEQGGDHLVPLSWQAVDVLQALKTLTGRFPLCFPGERHLHKPISENTLRALLIRAGYYQRHVPHGFRAAFSTYMNELVDRRWRDRGQDGLSPDRAIIDLMLAHKPKDKVEGAYNRAAYLIRRRELAQEWADLLLDGFCSPAAHLGQPMRRGASRSAVDKAASCDALLI